MKLVLATGRELNIIRVVKGGMIDYLHIYINELNPAEIYSIFNNNSEETKTITVYTDEETDTKRIYRGYTDLFSVQKPILTSPENTWMVWLQRPVEVSE